MTAALLDKGTATRTAVQIAETVEGVGGSIGAGADQDNLTRERGRAERPAAARVRAAERRGAAPHLSASRSWRRRARSRWRPCARRWATRPRWRRACSTGRCTATRTRTAAAPRRRRWARSPVTTWWRSTARTSSPRNALLVVSRRRDAGAGAGDGAPLASASGRAAPAPQDAFPTPPARAAGGDLPRPPPQLRAVVAVSWAIAGISPDDPDYYAAQVLNMVLGLSGDSRLEEVLRGQHGWTYGARSRFNRLLGGGTFSASTRRAQRGDGQRAGGADGAAAPHPRRAGAAGGAGPRQELPGGLVPRRRWRRRRRRRAAGHHAPAGAAGGAPDAVPAARGAP